MLNKSQPAPGYDIVPEYHLPKIPRKIGPESPDGHIDKKTFHSYFHHHSMTRTEIMEVYNFADVDRDGSLSPSEWGRFWDLFVSEFQECDTSKQWFMNSKDLGDCISKSTWLKYFAPNGRVSQSLTFSTVNEDAREKATLGNDIMFSADRNGDGKINFLEQLYIRKAAIAWKKCVSSRLLIRADLKCAMVIAANARNMDDHEGDFVFRLGIEMSDREWNIGITFNTFLILSDCFRTFSLFEKGVSDGMLSFQEIRFAVNQQRIPNLYTPAMINSYETLLESKDVTFPSFMTFTLFTKLFLTYAKNDKFNDIFVLDRDSYSALLQDRNTPLHLRIIMDNVYTKIPKEFYVLFKPDYMHEEKKWKHKDINYNDMDYLGKYKFKQIPNKGPSFKPFQEETQKSKIVVNPGQGISQRSVIFNAIDTNQNGTVSFIEYLRFVRAYKLFRYLNIGDDISYLKTDKESIKVAMDSIVPGVEPFGLVPLVRDSIKQIYKYTFNQRINFKQFLTILNDKQQFENMEIENAGNDFVISTLEQLDQRQIDLLWEQIAINPKAVKINNLDALYGAVVLEANAVARYKRSIHSNNFIKQISSLTLHDIAPKK